MDVLREEKPGTSMEMDEEKSRATNAMEEEGHVFQKAMGGGEAFE